MKDISVLIVDDEPNAVRGLNLILNRQPGIKVLDTCTSGAAAVQRISGLCPDVLLLDIEMPGMSGFEVVSKIGKEKIPFLIFVTAHEEFALQAFEVHAFDYILKPVDHHRLISVFDRIRTTGFPPRIQQEPDRIESLLATIAAGEETHLESSRRLSIKSRGSIVLVSTRQITRIEAAGNYVRYFVEGNCYLSRSTMNDVERQLASASFIRIHRSTIVNAERVVKVTPRLGGEFVVELEDGSEHVTGQSFRDRIQRLIKT